MIKKSKRFKKTLVFILILTIIILLLCVFLVRKVFFPLEHLDIVKLRAKENKIDPYLVLAIIKAESGFDKKAISSKKAKGLMQIMDKTASEINEAVKIASEINDTNIYDENVNISLGCKYFSDLIKRYDGNYYIAICAYNAGMGNVDKWIEQGIIDKKLDEYVDVELPFVQTQKYLYKVITNYKMYKFLYKHI